MANQQYAVAAVVVLLADDVMSRPIHCCCPGDDVWCFGVGFFCGPGGWFQTCVEIFLRLTARLQRTKSFFSIETLESSFIFSSDSLRQMFSVWLEIFVEMFHPHMVLDSFYPIFHSVVAYSCRGEMQVPTSICDVMFLCCYLWLECSESKALVPSASNKLGEWLSDWVIDWVRSFSPLASLAMEAAKETKFGTKVA